MRTLRGVVLAVSAECGGLAVVVGRRGGWSGSSRQTWQKSPLSQCCDDRTAGWGLCLPLE
jgi:hypothetical protein